MSIRDDFFTALSKGAKWDVGVSIARTNPLPLDANSVFKSMDELNTYCSGVLAYVGQPVAVVEADKTTLYVLDQNKVPQPVGSATAGDGKTIELTNDGILRIVGTGDAENPVAVGAQLVMGDNGTVRWVKPDTTTVEGLSSAVEALNQSVSGIDSRVTTTESDIDALEAKLAGMGGIFNFAGSVDGPTFANMAANEYDAGDVILVDGTKEYVCVEIVSEVEDEQGNKTTQTFKRWEVLGDPSGVTALQGIIGTEATGTPGTEDYVAATGLIGDVRTAQSDISALKSSNVTLTSDVANLKSKDTELANSIAEKAAQTDLDDAVARIGVNETAIGALEAKDSAIDSALETKATITYVDNKVSELNGKIDGKADQSVVDNLVQTAATKTELTEGLGTKVNTSDYNTKMSALESADTANSEAISAARAIADKNKTDIANINTALEGKASASDLSSLTTRVGNAETTIGEHTSSINTLSGTVSGLETNKADKTALEALAKRVATNEGGIASNLEALNALKSRVDTHDTDIAKAQEDATKGIEDAATAQSAAEAAQAKGEEALAKAEEVLGASTDEATANTVYGAKAAAAAADAKATTAQEEVDALEQTVSNLDNAYKSADAAIGARIDAIDAVIGGVQGAMHFVGISSTDPETEVKINDALYAGIVGDVVLYENKEYVCTVAGSVVEGVVISSGTWVELGDVSAEAKRIGDLEDRMDAVEIDTAKIAGIQSDVSDNASAIEALAARVKVNEDYRGTNDAALAALAARVTANEGAIAKEITDRDNAVKAEATARAEAINAEASARESAINDLQGQINTVVAKLTWTKIGE